MVMFRDNVGAVASDGTNPILTDKVETLVTNMNTVGLTASRHYGNNTKRFLMSIELTSGGVAHMQAVLHGVTWPLTPPPSASCNPFITPATYSECDFFCHGTVTMRKNGQHCEAVQKIAPLTLLLQIFSGHSIHLLVHIN